MYHVVIAARDVTAGNMIGLHFQDEGELATDKLKQQMGIAQNSPDLFIYSFRSEDDQSWEDLADIEPGLKGMTELKGRKENGSVSMQNIMKFFRRIGKSSFIPQIVRNAKNKRNFSYRYR